MSAKDLSKHLAGKFSARATPAEVMLRAGQEARALLRSGQAVDLLGVIRVRLTPEAIKGKAQGAAAIQALPLPGLLNEPAKPETDRGVHVVIAVAREDRFTTILAKRLTIPNQTGHVAVGVQGVMEVVKTHGANVIIMDSDLEMGDEIREWLKLGPDRSLISLIVIYRQKEETAALDRFRICEDEFLIEPYEMEGLQSLINGEITRIQQERKYFRHEVSFQFPTKPVFQAQAGDFMEKLTASSGLDEAGQMGLVVAFREAVDNASRHGNKSDGTAVITVAYVVDKEKVTVTVEDEGPGFDTTMYLDTTVSGNAVEVARQRHKEGRQGGLGIMLMLKSVDKLEYNREGNTAKLTKYLPKRAAAG